MSNPKWRFIPVTEDPALHSFDCGIDELNAYLKRYAGQNHRKGIGKTNVLVPVDGVPVAVGFYTLCMAQVDLRALPESFQKGLPQYPVPAVRLARLAVDRKWQGKGLGELLLIDAIHRSVLAAESMAAKFMIVDAINLKAEGFYRQYGFEPFVSHSRALVAVMDTLRRI